MLAGPKIFYLKSPLLRRKLLLTSFQLFNHILCIGNKICRITKIKPCSENKHEFYSITISEETENMNK